MKEGGLDVSWLIVYTRQDSLNAYRYAKARENTMAKYNAIHRLCDSIAPDKIELALNSEYVRRIHASGRKAAMIGVEIAYPMEEESSAVEEYHELGARYSSLSHNGHRQFYDLHTGEEDDDWLYYGLSNIVKRSVNEMNILDILLDISHLSKTSTDQLIRLSKAPVFASHSSARALWDHSRNMDDDSLKLLKKYGCAVQTEALGAYLVKDKSETLNASDFVYHID